MSDNGAEQGKELFPTFKDVLRIKLCSDYTADVEPYCVTLKINENHTRQGEEDMRQSKLLSHPR